MAKIVRVLSLLGISYRAACLVGFLIAGLLYPLAETLHAESDGRLLLLLLIVGGPVAGCVVTFVARRLIDVALRLFPALKYELSSDFGHATSHFEIRALLVASGIIAIGIAVVLVAISGSGRSAPMMEKCFLSRSCSVFGGGA